MVAAMHADLVRELEAYRKIRNFDVKAWTEKKTDMFADYLRKCGLKGAVISVSGGVDSAVTLALCMETMKKADSPLKKVIGLAQPISSTPGIQNRAYEVGTALGAEIVTIDQTELHTTLGGIVDSAVGIKGEGYAKGQLRSYMRTPTGYYAAQLLAQSGFPAVVMGTGNMDEDGYLLYYCKAGDGVVDVQLIADLHKSEVFAVGKHLGVPASVLEAPPSADLWDGQTDEDELGFTYDFIELYQYYLSLSDEEKETFKGRLSTAGRAEFDETAAKADAVHRRNSHKLESPVNINIL